MLQIPITRRRLGRTLGCVLAAAALAAPLAAWAQNYPSKVVRIIVPFPAGGTQDVLTRIVAEPLGKRLKQPVVVENKGGAAGNLGADSLAKSAPDGYTIGLLSGVHSANAAFFRKIPFSLESDFVPIKALGESPVIYVTSPKAKYSTPQEFLAYAKANPGKIQAGSTTSFAIDLLKMQSGIDVQFIPYKGVGEALQDLMGDRIDIGVGPAPQLLPLIRSNKLKAFAMGSGHRIPELPDVVPFSDALPDYDIGMWFALFAPKNTPPDIIARLNKEMTEVLNDPSIKDKIAKQSVDLKFSSATAADIQGRMAAEVKRWKLVAEKTGNYVN